MSDHRLTSLLWAIGLIVGGIVLLLFNFDLLTNFEPFAQYGLATIFAIVGIVFFVAYLSARSNWWRLIPAWTLVALAAMVVCSTIPTLDQRITAALLFVGLALAFTHIYWLNRNEYWWAIIPGGFMLVLGIVIAASAYLNRTETLGALLFMGMGAVFFVLYTLTGQRRHWWSIVPGAVLLLFGFFIFTLGESVQDGAGAITTFRWWPLFMIGLGLFLGWRAHRQTTKPEKLVVNSVTATSHRHQSKAPSQIRKKSTDSSQPSTETIRSAPGTSIEILPDPDNE